MWFSWATPFDIVTAWRKVGIAGNVLAPELIDRTEFIDQPPAATPAAVRGATSRTPGTDAAPVTGASPMRATRKRSAAELAMTPEGMVSGSVESVRAREGEGAAQVCRGA